MTSWAENNSIRRGALASTAVLLTLGLLVACTKKTPIAADEEPRPRIVCLSPALSQVLIDLGVGGHIVGCTPWAPEALDSVPVVGDLLSPDLERISAVRPDLIVVQPTQRGVDPGLQALAETNDWMIAAWELNRLSDLEGILDELPDLLVREEIDRAELDEVVRAWRARRDRLLVADEHMTTLGPTALLFGVDPPMVFGSETYLDDLWTTLGGENAFRRSGYIECSLEDLVTLSPATVVVIGNGLDQARASAESLQADLGPASGRMVFRPVDGTDLLVPGTRLLDGIASLQAAMRESVE